MPTGLPLPSLATAARNLRAARASMLGTHPSDPREHRLGLIELRGALRSYVGALERTGLPVASKLRHELALLDTLDEPRRFG